MLKFGFRLTILCLLVFPLKAGFFGNRYLPAYNFPAMRKPDAQSNLSPSVFFMTADEAYGFSDDYVTIPRLDGEFNLRTLDKALREVNYTSPLRPQYRLDDLKYNIAGKVQAQGLRLSFGKSITDLFSIGATVDFMRVTSRQEFSPASEITSSFGSQPGLIDELDRARRDMQSLLGIQGDQWQNSGPGDCDCYLRFGKVRDYVLKCRKVDAGISLGMILPIGMRREEDWAPSIPFSGNGHFGMYFAGDAEFELREDLRIGGFIQIGSLFAKTQKRRIPIQAEPQAFGVAFGNARVDPGVNFSISPYVAFDNVANGFGAKIRYTFTHHSNDFWEDKRTDKTVNGVTVAPDFSFLNSETTWASEYFTLNLFYDRAGFSKSKSYIPTIHFNCDIPTKLFSFTSQSSRTYRMSLGMEFKF